MAAEPILASTLWRPSLGGSATPVATAAHSKLATGLHQLDTALDGGLDHGIVTCISAETSSGASELVQALVVSHLLGAPSARATLIDTTMLFDIRSLHKSLVEGLWARGSDAGHAMLMLERLKIMKVFDFVGLTECVSEVRNNIEDAVDAQPVPRGTVDDSEDEEEMLDAPTPPQQRPPSPPQTSTGASPGSELLIIDNITSVTAPLLKSNHAQGQALLTSFVRSLCHLTKAQNLCTVIINGTVSYAQSKEETPSIFSSCISRPALGRTFTYLLDVHLLVHQVPKTAANARALYGGKKDSRPGGGVEMVSVVEVLQDRSGGRGGRWAAFDVGVDGKLVDVG